MHLKHKKEKDAYLIREFLTTNKMKITSKIVAGKLAVEKKLKKKSVNLMVMLFIISKYPNHLLV